MWDSNPLRISPTDLKSVPFDQSYFLWFFLHFICFFGFILHLRIWSYWGIYKINPRNTPLRNLIFISPIILIFFIIFPVLWSRSFKLILRTKIQLSIIVKFHHTDCCIFESSFSHYFAYAWRITLWNHDFLNSINSYHLSLTLLYVNLVNFIQFYYYVI